MIEFLKYCFTAPINGFGLMIFVILYTLFIDYKMNKMLKLLKNILDTKCDIWKISINE